jgi:hypothetical protein
MSNLVYNDQDLLVLVDSGVPHAAVDQDLAVLVTQRLVPALIHLGIDQDLMVLIEKLGTSRVNITGTFQDAAGNPIAFGTLAIRLSTDATSVDGSQVDDQEIVITLDANGDIYGLRLFPNSLLTSGTPPVYIARVFTASGQPVWGEWTVTVANTDPSPLVATTINY